MNVEKRILNGILSVIEVISDIEFQNKAWIRRKEHDYAFFEETMHNLFDDYEIREVLNNYKNYGISDEQYVVLERFYKAIDKFSDEKMSWLQYADPQKVIADPRWQEIQHMAKEVLKAFNYHREI